MARRIGRKGLEKVMAAIAVDLVETAEYVGFAVLAGNVTRGQDLQLALAVPALNHLVLDDKLLGEDRIGGDEFLRQGQVVRRLALVIGKNVAVVTLVGRPSEEAIERREDQIGRFPIFLGAAVHRHVDLRIAVLIERPQDALEDAAPVRLDRVEERTPIDPDEMAEELERMRRAVRMAIAGAQGLAGGHRPGIPRT